MRAGRAATPPESSSGPRYRPDVPPPTGSGRRFRLPSRPLLGPEAGDGDGRGIADTSETRRRSFSAACAGERRRAGAHAFWEIRDREGHVLVGDLSFRCRSLGEDVVVASVVRRRRRRQLVSVNSARSRGLRAAVSTMVSCFV